MPKTTKLLGEFACKT